MRRSELWMVLPALIVLLLAINVPPYVPLQDYNEWVYQGFLAAQLLHGNLTDQFVFATFPVPNSAVQAVLCLLNLVVPPLVAARCVASLYVIAAIALAWQLAQKMSLEQNVSYFYLLLVCVFFNTPFWNGYVNYQFGILLFTAWLLQDGCTRAKPLWVLLFTVGAFFTHAVIWASILLMMAIDALRRRRFVSYLPALPSVGLFVWYVARKPAPTVPDPSYPTGLLHASGYKLYTFAKLGPYHNFTLTNGIPSAIETVGRYAGFAVNIALAAGLLYLLYAALWRPLMRREAWAQLSDETLASLVLFVLFIAMPTVMADVVNPGERMLYPAMMLALLGVGKSRVAQRLVPWLACSAFVLALCALGLMANRALLAADVARADEGQGIASRAFFGSRPNAFADVMPIFAGRSPIRMIGFETSFLFNRINARINAHANVRTDSRNDTRIDTPQPRSVNSWSRAHSSDQ
ncbi:hypothetical protein [Paraburkholderia pallida]|uniref:EpsG family protein n=1 Tax=Paraburkholderia pallida TaxID=2547399 RepID=A0A4P7CR79_9BURK|nr:hypothetical protein [Paraburkholderia pallida]QBQ98390.1 hypothetical protein E1956_15245 [Paraburkholderia pallida]